MRLLAMLTLTIEAIPRSTFQYYPRQDSNSPSNLQARRENCEQALQKELHISSIDPDLRRLIDAWTSLPDAVRAGILATIDAHTNADRFDGRETEKNT
jgi:hypothetical protein